MPAMLLWYYRKVLDDAEPYLIARQPVREGLDRVPLGIPIAEENIFDPLRSEGREFINLVKHLDEMAYGPLGLSMPSWVFYDCAVMPGAVFGFARRAAGLPDWVKKVLKVPETFQGLVPLSIFVAIPMVNREASLIYTLCSINQIAAGAAPEGLWRLTLAAGTAALGVEAMVGTAQWRSPHLGLYAALGPLELMTSWTPAHDNPATCTFRVKTHEYARERLLRGDLIGPEGIHRYLDADDFEAMRALQVEIESGLRVAVAGPAEIRGSETRVPLQIQDGDGRFALDSDVGFTRRFQG